MRHPDEAPFRARRHRHPESGFTVVELAGEIDIAATLALRPRLIRLATGPSPALAVDLRHATFLDAAGLGLLVALRSRVRENGGRWCLICDHPVHLRVIRATRLTETLRPSPTLEAGLLRAC
ncbi:STAS domain-containing protein [Streptomyces beihaiensis]|uniref:Anti-sigma factor antagonist n=1 Tax=Streptomyces beihaiensis TaxID=2984495 RepID=A0ABT3TX47_9ACTN|nr:STAS domain-containing protein [Streptomyces beihaiensis]MCX3061627.1 STAS domain-containing protein [Streptomyces beihaiensis]